MIKTRRQKMIKRIGSLGFGKIWFLLLSGFLSLSAAGCVRPQQDGESPSGVLTLVARSETRVGEMCKIETNPPCAFKQEAFNLDDPAARRMAGSLTTLSFAFRGAFEWTVPPVNAGGFMATPEFQALNLWDPYSGRPAILMDADPADKGLVGEYHLWQDGEYWWGSATTRGGTLRIVLAPYSPQGIARLAPGEWESPSIPSQNAEGFTPPIGMKKILAYCRILDWVGQHADPSNPHLYSYPGVAEHVSPPADLEDLKGYWWLWDSEAMLTAAPLALEDLIFAPSGTAVRPVCRTEKGSVWHWGTRDERTFYADWASEVTEEKGIEH